MVDQALEQARRLLPLARALIAAEEVLSTVARVDRQRAQLQEQFAREDKERADALVAARVEEDAATKRTQVVREQCEDILHEAERQSQDILAEAHAHALQIEGSAIARAEQIKQESESLRQHLEDVREQVAKASTDLSLRKGELDAIRQMARSLAA